MAVEAVATEAEEDWEHHPQAALWLKDVKAEFQEAWGGDGVGEEILGWLHSHQRRLGQADGRGEQLLGPCFLSAHL